MSLSVEGAIKGCSVDADGSLPRFGEGYVGCQHGIGFVAGINIFGKLHQVLDIGNLKVLNLLCIAAQSSNLLVGKRRFPEGNLRDVGVGLLAVLVAEQVEAERHYPEAVIVVWIGCDKFLAVQINDVLAVAVCHHDAVPAVVLHLAEVATDGTHADLVGVDEEVAVVAVVGICLEQAVVGSGILDHHIH